MDNLPRNWSLLSVGRARLTRTIGVLNGMGGKGDGATVSRRGGGGGGRRRRRRAVDLTTQTPQEMGINRMDIGRMALGVQGEEGTGQKLAG